MVRNILSRLLQAVCVLLGVALLIFIMLRIVPGNPIATLMGEHADRAVIERMTAELGLDQPILRQFIRYLAGEYPEAGCPGGSLCLDSGHYQRRDRCGPEKRAS